MNLLVAKTLSRISTNLGKLLSQAGGKGQAQDATSDFYTQLKALALAAFGAEDIQYLETLGLGAVKMKV